MMFLFVRSIIVRQRYVAEAGAGGVLTSTATVGWYPTSLADMSPWIWTRSDLKQKVASVTGQPCRRRPRGKQAVYIIHILLQASSIAWVRQPQAQKRDRCVHDDGG